jgi:hypothetical protein
MKTKSILVALLFGATIFSSCTKEGPAGPIGNANVVSSSISTSNWINEDPMWTLNLSYPAITQEIINTGAVLVYMKYNSSPYIQLPITFTNQGYSSIVDFESFVGGLKIHWTDTDLSLPENPGNRDFKIVVIAASGLAKNPNLDFNNYDKVKKAFNLNDEQYQVVQ